MATLTGNKVKDSYQSLLKLSSGGATSTIKTVEDGLGVETALKVGTDTVEVNSLKITTTPTVSSSENTVLVYDDATDEVKTRELNTSAFQNVNSFSNIAVSGQTTVVADSGTDTLTLVAGTGMTITTNETTDTITLASSSGVGAVNDLSDVTITSASNGDLLYYNGTAWVNDSTPRTVAFVDNTNAVNFAVPNSNGNILFEAGTGMSISYNSNTVSFSASGASSGVFEETFIGTNASAYNLPNANDSAIIAFSTPNNTIDSTSFHFGNSPAQLHLDATNGEYIENLTNDWVPVFVDMSANTEVTANNSNITYTLQKWDGTSWTDIKSASRVKSVPGSFIDSFWGVFMLGANQRLRIRISTTTGNIALSASSQFKFVVKETGNIL